MVKRVFLLSALLVAVQARAYYDAIVIDAEDRTDDGERPAHRRAKYEDCLQPKQSGHCRAFFQSYFYNMETRQCELFIYSGCGGNNNRFETLEQCEKVCAVKRKEDLTAADSKKCSQDATPPVCNKGCRTVLDSNDCPKCYCPSSVCSLPAVRGHCRALLPRWRFDKDSGKCVEFKFGGCDGNGNNFRTEQQCMRTCGGFQE